MFTVHAVDNYDEGVNAEIEYFIDSSNLILIIQVIYLLPLVSPSVINAGGGVKFQIDQTTGVVQTGSIGFDYEDPTDRYYTIVIIARDKGTNPMRLTVNYYNYY